MNTRSFLRRLAAGLAALGVLASAAGAALAATPDPVISPAWPMDTALAYRWTTGAVPPSAIQSAVNAAASGATSSRASRSPSYAYYGAAANGVSYGTSNPCGVIGLGCFQRDPASNYWHLWFRENGHRYDWGSLVWCEMSGSPNGCYQAQTITIDELGHVAGLDHHVNLNDGSDYGDAVVQQYSHVRPLVGWNASVFGRCDVATLQQLYDVASWTTLYSTCLDIPTTLTVSASATQVVSGASVTFTATLLSNGTGRLAGNPMAGRVVTLQALSGTTWTDVAAMSAGSTPGTYRATYFPRTQQAYRAVFRKPASEGVRAATSGSVTVSITCSPTKCPLAQPAARQ